MKTIYFRDDVYSGIADSGISAIVDNFIDSEQSSITVSNSLVVNAFRLAVKQGRIDHEDIMIEYIHTDPDTGEEQPTSVFIDKNGSLDHYPNEVYSVNEKILYGLMGW